jgi:hypothetical protein
MTSFYQVAGPVLLTAALVSGCGYGSGANIYTGPASGTGAGSGGTTIATGAAGETGGGGIAGGATGAGGIATAGGGGTATGAGGNRSGGAGGETGTGGTATGVAGADAGTAIGGGGGTATGAGGTTTGAGGNSTGGAGGKMGTSPTPEWGTPVAGGPTGTGVIATVTVNPSTIIGTIGPGFAGFSYEKTHITNGSLTSTNTSLVALYKLIGSPVMRLGADDVENCNWAGAGAAPTGPSGQPFTKNITTGDVDELCSFLAATGTKIIYAVNFKAHNVTASAAEAAYVQGKCGSSIYGFEIGNEINFDGSWPSLKTEWESFATAITATPGALLIGPAAYTGNALTFSTPFAADESAKFGSKLVLLTQHYYAGRAGTSNATVSHLQTPDPNPPTSQSGLVGQSTTMNTAVTTNKIPQGYRCGECNTFAGHGQMGVSDTLIAGLWGLDLMFVTAEHGGSGVNLHGGETGMDGTVPFFYEPIMENKGVVVQVQPIYYSMLILNLAGQGPMVSATVNTTNPYFTAYAIKANGYTSVILDNKDASSGVNATVNMGSAAGSASAIYLQGTPAGSLSAPATAVTFAGASVTAAGVWNRNPPFIQTTSGSAVSVYVPAASAALVRVLP